MGIRSILAAILLVPAVLVSSDARGQSTAPPPATTSPAGAAAPETHPVGDRKAFTPEELEQMLAAVALYPDALLTQIFMASTYPIEIVEADRWVKKNPNLKGDALATELEKQSWDPSVRSLVNFPDILSMMSEQIGTTLKIGDAFIGQQKEVMDAVQRLRAKAKAAGNLESSEQMNITTAPSDSGPEVIVIESTSPEVIYVPSYDPVYVYGGWPYPSYPPYPYYPYPVVNPLLSFGVGVACGVAWGYAWGNCNWGHGDVDIDIDRNTNINGNIDRDKFKQNMSDRQGNRDTRQGNRQDNRDTRQGNRQGGGQAGGKGTWQHDPSHRQGVSYRNRDSANKVGAATVSDRATQARSDYRGRAEAGRRDIASGAANSARNNAAAGANRSAAANRPSTGNRATAGNRAPTGSGGALDGSRRSGSDARASSARGSSSRSVSPSRSSGSRSSGVSRGGSRGGGARGGGGRGGGGRR